MLQLLKSSAEPVAEAEEKPSIQPGPVVSDTRFAKAVLPAGTHAGRRRLARIIAGALFVAILAPAALWVHFQATHIVTRNALVRAHLSELGVRGEGVVREVRVTAGDIVRKGDTLVQLEDSHLQARRQAAHAMLSTIEERIALREAERAYAEREASVRVAKAVAEHKRSAAEAEAAILRAEDSAAYHAARRSLAKDGSISAETLRDAAAKAARDRSLASAADAATTAARAELEAAQLALEGVALQEGELRVLRAQQREARAELEQVEADIESMRIIAPADGAVIRRLAQPGMAVATGTPILSLWFSDETWIEAWVPEEKIGEFSTGSAVQVSFPALPGQRFSGTVARIGLATDFEMPEDYLPQSRESRMRPTPHVGVEVRLDHLPAMARPGLSAVVDIDRDGA